MAGAAYEHAMSQLSEYAEQGIPAVAMINAGSIRQSIPKVGGGRLVGRGGGRGRASFT